MTKVTQPSLHTVGVYCRYTNHLPHPDAPLMTEGHKTLHSLMNQNRDGLPSTSKWGWTSKEDKAKIEVAKSLAQIFIHHF